MDSLLNCCSSFFPFVVNQGGSAYVPSRLLKRGVVTNG